MVTQRDLNTGGYNSIQELFYFENISINIIKLIFQFVLVLVKTEQILF